MNITSFKKDIIKVNPISTLVDSYKKNMSMEFLTIKEYEEKYGGKKATISIKIDGEMCGIKFDGENTITYTRGGFIRYDFPATKEFTDTCKSAGIKEFTGLCELYVVNEEDKPISYMKSQSILKLPKTEEESARLRILVFDVYSINNNVVINNSITERIKQITSLFKTEGGKVSSAKYYVNEDITKIDELWQQVIRPDVYGYEGLIVYLDDKIIKIKPILSFDMVIVALNRSKNDPNMISAVVASFLDKDMIFRFHGKIGSGFSASDRELLFQWAERNKTWEDETGQIWVDPFKEPLIIEVQGEEVNIKNKPAYKFDTAEKEWIRVEDRMSGVIRYPVILKFRNDKKVTPEDLRLEQIPGFKDSESSLNIQDDENNCFSSVGGQMELNSGWLISGASVLSEEQIKSDIDAIENFESEKEQYTETQKLRRKILKSQESLVTPNVGIATKNIATYNLYVKYITIVDEMLKMYGVVPGVEPLQVSLKAPEKEKMPEVFTEEYFRQRDQGYARPGYEEAKDMRPIVEGWEREYEAISKGTGNKEGDSPIKFKLDRFKSLLQTIDNTATIGKNGVNAKMLSGVTTKISALRKLLTDKINFYTLHSKY